MSDKFTEYPQYDNDTTTDCEDCEARIRAEVIDEFVEKLNNIFKYRHDMYEIEEIAKQLKG